VGGLDGPLQTAEGIGPELAEQLTQRLEGLVAQSVQTAGALPPQFLDTVQTALLHLATDHTPHELGEKVDELLVACGVESSADRAAQKRLERRGLTIAS